MAENWQWLRSGPGRAAWNMALDEAILRAAQQPLLRFYSWTEPAATFGYFQKYDDVAAATDLRPLVRRCTGGGIVPHDNDWTYSLILPSGTDWFGLKAEESYRRAHEWVAAAFGRLQVSAELAPCCDAATPGQCFSGYEKHDVLMDGRKLAGAAQRRIRSGLLIQGSIQPPPGVSREAWEREFIAEAKTRLGAQWTEIAEDPFRSAATSLEREKYSTVTHNRRR